MISDNDRAEQLGQATREKLKKFIARIERLEGEVAYTDIVALHHPLIKIPFPLSVNAMYRAFARGNRVANIKTEKYRKWRETAVESITEQWGQRAIIDRPVKLDIAIRQPDRRKRDIDNMNKSILDALEGIAFTNDNLVHDIRTYWDFSEGSPQASILIQPISDGS